MDNPVVLVFVEYHGQHLGHCVVSSFDTAVTTGVSDARRKFFHAEELVNGGRKMGTELESIIGQEGDWAAPQGNKSIHKNVSSPFGREFCGGNGEHVSAAAETVGKMRM